MPNHTPLRDLVRAMTRIADEDPADAPMQAAGAGLLQTLVAQEGWLPEGFEIAPEGPGFGQRLLYCDPRERFSLVCFCWGGGRATPVHDHRVWGVVGVLRGAEDSVEMIPGPPGSVMRAGRVDRVLAGEVLALGPEGAAPGLYDIHRVENAAPGVAGVTIHLYGSNIGALPRGVFDAATSIRTEFVSGYDNAFLPNIWKG